MLASMIFRKEPFFHGQDNYDQVSKYHLTPMHLGADAKKIHLDRNAVVKSLNTTQCKLFFRVKNFTESYLWSQR